MKSNNILGIHTLKNGRKYKLVDHGKYIDGEYPKGGIHISCWDTRLNNGNGMWLYVSNAPNEECAKNFLKSAERLEPII